jgi:hypothetical protein
MKLKAKQLLYLLIFYRGIVILFFVLSLVYDSKQKYFPILTFPILFLPSILLRRAYMRKKIEESKK